MADNKEVKDSRSRLVERLRAKYPDKEYVEDEVLFSQIYDDYDTYDQELAGYHERDKTMSDMFESNPSSASFFTEWRNGGDPIVLMIQKYGDEFKDALEDPDRVEAIAQANKEYAARIAESEKYEAEFAKNIEETNATLDKVQEEDGLRDEQVDEAISFLMTLMKDCLVGKVSADSIRMAVKAVNYDTDVEEAEAVGEVRGRNAKIVEKLRKSNQGDGTANLSGKSSANAQTAMPELGAIDRYNGNTNIWERGGEKRRRINN